LRDEERVHILTLGRCFIPNIFIGGVKDKGDKKIRILEDLLVKISLHLKYQTV
jgi:hypothetical protein